jgi:hypothetical protein
MSRLTDKWKLRLLALERRPTPVSASICINRALREARWLEVRHELGGE